LGSRWEAENYLRISGVMSNSALALAIDILHDLRSIRMVMVGFVVNGGALYSE
jgi:hypothetical protein